MYRVSCHPMSRVARLLKRPFEKDTCINLQFWTFRAAFWAVFTTVVPVLIQQGQKWPKKCPQSGQNLLNCHPDSPQGAAHHGPVDGPVDGVVEQLRPRVDLHHVHAQVRVQQQVEPQQLVTVVPWKEVTGTFICRVSDPSPLGVYKYRIEQKKLVPGCGKSSARPGYSQPRPTMPGWCLPKQSLF